MVDNKGLCVSIRPSIAYSLDHKYICEACCASKFTDDFLDAIMHCPCFQIQSNPNWPLSSSCGFFFTCQLPSRLEAVKFFNKVLACVDHPVSILLLIPLAARSMVIPLPALQQQKMHWWLSLRGLLTVVSISIGTR